MALLVLLVASCSNPLDQPYKKETVDKDFKRIVDMEKISAADEKMMAEFMVKHDLIDESVLELGASYRDILEQAKKEQASVSKVPLVNKDSVRNQGTLEKLHKSVTVSFDDSSMLVKDNKLTCTYVIKNNSGKHIRSFVGDIVLKDVFGNEYKSSRLHYFKHMKESEEVKEVFNIELSPKNKNDVLILEGHYYFTCEWAPEAILFEDGELVNKLRVKSRE